MSDMLYILWLCTLSTTLNTLLYDSSHISYSVCRGIGTRDKLSVLSRGLVIDVVDLSLHNFQILVLIYKIMYCTV